MRTILEKNVWGVPLGPYLIYLRYAGQTFYTELEGEVSDATMLFTNKDLQEEFKDIIEEGVRNLYKLQPHVPTTAKTVNESSNSNNANYGAEASTMTVLSTTPLQQLEKTKVDELLTMFRAFDFSKACRVYFVKEGNSKVTHFLVQVGRLGSLAQYACYNNRSHYNFIKGATSKGKVDGLGLTLPEEYDLPVIGKAIVHLLCPDDPRDTSDDHLKETLKDAAPLAKILPLIPHVYNVKALIRSLRDAKRQLEDALGLMRKDLQDVRARYLAVKQALGKKGVDLDHIRLGVDATTYFCFLAPSFLLGAIGYSFEPLGSFVGFGIGFALGALIDSKR